MGNLNKSRANSLLNAGFLYSAITVVLLGLAMCKMSEVCLKWSFICFVITSVSIFLSYHIGNYDDTEPNPIVRMLGFIIMIPYVIFGGLLLIIMNILIFLCFGKRGDFHDE